MAEKRKGGNIVNAVWELAEPIAEGLGLEIWDVRFLKEGATWYLRIIIDKDGGIGIEDCVDLHHAIDEPLSILDPIEQSYNLQVCSAGLERELVREEHFKKYIDANIMLKTQKAVDGIKEFFGILKAYDKGIITLECTDGNELEFEQKALSWVRLDDFEGFE